MTKRRATERGNSYGYNDNDWYHANVSPNYTLERLGLFAHAAIIGEAVDARYTTIWTSDCVASIVVGAPVAGEMDRDESTSIESRK
jgi:hypothetical protein